MPVIVTEAVPSVAVKLDDRVKVLELPQGLGVNDAVTPFGKPDAVKFTFPAKPLDGATMMVLLAPLPWEIVRFDGVDDRLKFGPAVTVSVTVAV